uniref:RNase H type-1 domain-containing protein n=1 Tax=Cannabis sativa TaxID=3483 RepID=A0A803Q406_CANSA
MGNTAFFSACAAGILDIVDEFLKLKNCRDFITIPGGGDVSPLYIAVSFGHGKGSESINASRLGIETTDGHTSFGEANKLLQCVPMQKDHFGGKQTIGGDPPSTSTSELTVTCGPSIGPSEDLNGKAIPYSSSVLGTQAQLVDWPSTQCWAEPQARKLLMGSLTVDKFFREPTLFNPILNIDDFRVDEHSNGLRKRKACDGLTFYPSPKAHTSSGITSHLNDPQCPTAQAPGAAIFRDHNGQFKRIYTFKCQHCDSLAGEVAALYEGAAAAVKLGFNNVIFQSDSSNAIEAILLSPKDIKLLHHNIQEILRKFHLTVTHLNLWEACWIPRSCNRVAHFAAQEANRNLVFGQFDSLAVLGSLQSPIVDGHDPS